MRKLEVIDVGGLRKIVVGPTALVLAHAHICCGSEVKGTLLGLGSQHARRRALRRLMVTSQG